MNTEIDLAFINCVMAIGRSAGAVLKKYANSSTNQVFTKEDQSPVTLADRESDAIIRKQLKAMFPNIPIISEESSLPPYKTRSRYPLYWLIDPLDGTKEFIQGLEESCVCMALIEAGKVVFSLIDDPFREVQYYAIQSKGAFKAEYEGPTISIEVRKHSGKQPVRILQSRSKPVVEGMELESCPITWVPKGSALKFCHLAEGKAHLYFRWSPFREWDAAAGHLIAEEAGAQVTDLEGNPVVYGSESLLLKGIVVDAKPWKLSSVLALRERESH
ncbi:MAG: 3'(2'),5'-bisphosphate nucleotidase CysQ [Acidobacteria bacterium]|nr:MAG: 3'(2'),5'-bisphosphate nucleotidase CysQ [Acidobacteriota bacterium]